MHASSIHDARIALDRRLLSIAVEGWGEESRSGYMRIKSFGNPNSLAVIELLSLVPNSDRDELFRVLPKQSRTYLEQADAAFFSSDERRLVEKFVGKMSQLSAPYFDGNAAITAMFDKHMELRTGARTQALKIKRCLSSYLRSACKEWDGYSLIKPEPNMIVFEWNSSKYRIAVNWDLRPWEIFCGLDAYEGKERLISNHTFFGGLGISANPAWYSDEDAALEAITVCANHALKVSQAVASVLNDLNSTREP